MHAACPRREDGTMHRPGNTPGKAKRLEVVARKGRLAIAPNAMAHRALGMRNRPPRARTGALSRPPLPIAHGRRSAGGTRP